MNTFICRMCRSILFDEKNCGAGDCLYCMAEAGDPQCISGAIEEARVAAAREVMDSENEAGEDL